MALREKQTIFKIEVLCEMFNIIQVIEGLVVYRDDVEISRTNSGRVVKPGFLQDNGGEYERTYLTLEHQDVRNIANLLWSNEIHSSFEAHLRSNEV